MTVRVARLLFPGWVLLVLATGASGVVAAADTEAGAHAFRLCAGCHSLDPGHQMTGPSLAHLWGRKAGTAKGFTHYSAALESSGIVWNEKTLDAWLADPDGLVPGNAMVFPGIRDAHVRADLIAYLREATADVTGPSDGSKSGRAVGTRDLKSVGPQQQVTAIRYCGDHYRVTTAAGALPAFWEFDLRFKTDSGPDGPARGHPVILRAGGTGHRAYVIFADPAEIGTFIKKGC